MPKTPSSGFWHQPRLWNCAKAGMLVVCSCRGCQRAVNYLAADLVQLFGELRLVGQLWGRCPRCGSVEFWSERPRYPTSDDIGTLPYERYARYLILTASKKSHVWGQRFYVPL